MSLMEWPWLMQPMLKWQQKDFVRSDQRLVHNLFFIFLWFMVIPSALWATVQTQRIHTHLKWIPYENHTCILWSRSEKIHYRSVYSIPSAQPCLWSSTCTHLWTAMGDITKGRLRSNFQKANGSSQCIALFEQNAVRLLRNSWCLTLNSNQRK